jgi:hypothetical protein
VGDVGQDAYEEFSLVPKGGNAGWKVMEGAHCRPGGPGNCNMTGLIQPVIERPQSGGECSAIGGGFFRGDPAAAFHDVYFFGDYCSGKIWAMRVQNGTRVTDAQIGSLSGLSAITTDLRGRVFAMSVNSNTIRILESPDMRPNPSPISKRISHRVLQPVSRRDLFEGDQYRVRGLDGRRAGSQASGILVVSKKGAKTPAQLVPAVW